MLAITRDLRARMWCENGAIDSERTKDVSVELRFAFLVAGFYMTTFRKLNSNNEEKREKLQKHKTQFFFKFD